MTTLTAKKRKALVRLAKMPDHRIDLSDIPEIKRPPSDALTGKFYRRKASVRDDESAVVALRSRGR
jgi:hypothetical protein